jgi:hypothetical protein
MAHCQDEPESDEEFFVDSRMGIHEVRMLYDSLTFYRSIWPGPPARPEEEKDYLDNVRNKLYAAIMEYNLIFNDVKEME